MGYEPPPSTLPNNVAILCIVLSLLTLIFFQLIYTPSILSETSKLEKTHENVFSQEIIIKDVRITRITENYIVLKICIKTKNVPLVYVNKSDTLRIYGIKALVNGTSVDIFSGGSGVGYNYETGEGKITFTRYVRNESLITKLETKLNITVFLNTTIGMFKYTKIETITLTPPEIKLVNNTVQVINTLPFSIEIYYNVTLANNTFIISNKTMNEPIVLNPGETWTYTPYFTSLINTNIVHIKIVCTKINYTTTETIVVKKT
ncbi:hypothetical protein J4526_00730 [Desulfurococcaceae archaeon MEX13E-LK6-19]|nr:hypothetical protein J4526_00730 [Desulfurococcaceae archaeon MEX13E-LK6-19]